MSTTNMIAEPASVHGSPHTIGKAEAAAQTVRSRIIAAPSLDALYRAALTFCIDGADAMMYATHSKEPNMLRHYGRSCHNVTLTGLPMFAKKH